MNYGQVNNNIYYHLIETKKNTSEQYKFGKLRTLLRELLSLDFSVNCNNEHEKEWGMVEGPITKEFYKHLFEKVRSEVEICCHRKAGNVGCIHNHKRLVNNSRTRLAQDVIYECILEMSRLNMFTQVVRLLELLRCLLTIQDASVSHGNRKDYNDKLSDMLSTEVLKTRLLTRHTVEIEDKKVVLDSIIFSENIEAGWYLNENKMIEFKALKFRTNLFIKSVFEFIKKETETFLGEQV